MKKKPKIILNWNYERPDLTRPLLKIADDFEFVFIYRQERDGAVEPPDSEVLYFGDFPTPYSLLQAVCPKKVVFCDIESFYEVGLNIAAKNLSIPTYHLEHGNKDPDLLELAFRADMEQAHARSILKRVWNALSRGFPRSLLFYLSSFRAKNWRSLPGFLAFIPTRFVFGVDGGLRKSQLDLRYADHYINYTEENCRARTFRDPLAEGRYILIGNPTFDDFFDSENIREPDTLNPYALLLDTPHVEMVQYQISPEEKKGFYARLNESCKARNTRLVVKLHPRNYGAGYLHQDENISYLQEADFVDLIFRASACYSFTSSLALPAILFRKACLFTIGPERFQAELADLGVVLLADFFEFSPEEIDLSGFSPDQTGFSTFQERYFKYLDGRSIERLRGVLLSPDDRGGLIE